MIRVALYVLVYLASCILFGQAIAEEAKETFEPYNQTNVPQSAIDLWKDYDPRKEPIKAKVLGEWTEDGVTTEYLTFSVGTFKGTEARIAAYYTFPAKSKEFYPPKSIKHPAFVWSHGGGQRADRNRGIYFAKQGYATLDINWLGRPVEKDIEVNTDWGKVDPTQGPRFYSKALRKGWKRNLQPDEFTIDPVISPRNSNWFLLAVAARRAITFLEQQDEVDPERIGFTGFSMGGMITALTAPDSRLKAVAPFVGGTGFKYVDFPGVEGSGLSVHFRNNDLELYKNTMDPSSYWPQAKCPVMFISSTNDFHSAFDRIYRSMALLKHPNWRVTTNVHANHGPGPEQWVMLNQWFDQYLKRVEQNIPETPPSSLTVKDGVATFTVEPEAPDRLVETEVYYSYDSNSRTRFWNRAKTSEVTQGERVELTVHDGVPLYVFAMCRYKLDQPQELERGETKTFVLNSLEHKLEPGSVDPEKLKELVQPDRVFEDFSGGLGDWSSRNGHSLKTYKFQCPEIDRSNEKKLALTINPRGKKMSLRLKTSSKFLSRNNDQGDFSFAKNVSGEGPQKVLIDRSEFKNKDGKQLEWAKISTFSLTIVDLETKHPINLASDDGQKALRRIELVNSEN